MRTAHAACGRAAISNQQRKSRVPKEKAGPLRPGPSLVGVMPTITFQRGTAGCTTVAKSGRMSQPAAYSTRKLWARNLGRATQRLACQPCGPRKRWEILLGCGEKAMVQHCRRLRFARAGAAVGLPLLNSANAAPWRRENRETPGCARAT